MSEEKMRNRGHYMEEKGSSSVKKNFLSEVLDVVGTERSLQKKTEQESFGFLTYEKSLPKNSPLQISKVSDFRARWVQLFSCTISVSRKSISSGEGGNSSLKNSRVRPSPPAFHVSLLAPDTPCRTVDGYGFL